MPSRTRHIEQAKSNSRFLSAFDLAKTQHPDWAITVAFYTAVHLVEAVFASRSPAVHFYKHEDRNSEVSSALPDISDSYMAMYLAGRRARYFCQDVKPVEAQLLVAGHYRPVKEKLSAELATTV
jgi:hypothetical protein